MAVGFHGDTSGRSLLPAALWSSDHSSPSWRVCSVDYGVMILTSPSCVCCKEEPSEGLCWRSPPASLPHLPTHKHAPTHTLLPCISPTFGVSWRGGREREGGGEREQEKGMEAACESLLTRCIASPLSPFPLAPWHTFGICLLSPLSLSNLHTGRFTVSILICEHRSRSILLKARRERERVFFTRFPIVYSANRNRWWCVGCLLHQSDLNTTKVLPLKVGLNPDCFSEFSITSEPHVYSCADIKENKHWDVWLPPRTTKWVSVNTALFCEHDFFVCLFWRGKRQRRRGVFGSG